MGILQRADPEKVRYGATGSAIDEFHYGKK
jgi:hypothetical protein